MYHKQPPDCLAALPHCTKEDSQQTCYLLKDENAQGKKKKEGSLKIYKIYILCPDLRETWDNIKIIITIIIYYILEK